MRRFFIWAVPSSAGVTLKSSFVRRTKDSSKNNSTSLSTHRPRQDGVVPFAVECVRLNAQCCHLFIGHLASRRVAVRVQLALHSQAHLRPGCTDQFQDYRIALQRLTSPVLADPCKQPILYLVPFTRSRRQVPH